jgi:hypothetical protein
MARLSNPRRSALTRSNSINVNTGTPDPRAALTMHIALSAPGLHHAVSARAGTLKLAGRMRP